jgi:ABC-type polysaccharide/polyol phosphate export permease
MKKDTFRRDQLGAPSRSFQNEGVAGSRIYVYHRSRDWPKIHGGWLKVSVVMETKTVGGTKSNIQIEAAIADIVEGLRLWRIWAMLAWTDIRQRYRRSFIGPFWISISMCVMVGGMGLVYGTLFKQDMTNFLPFLAAGFLGWFFISTSVSEGATIFVQAEGLIKQGGLPLSLHLFRAIWRNLLTLFHNLVVIVGIYFWFGHFDLPSFMLAIPGLALAVINLTWILFILAPLCTRYRDLVLIVANVMQMLFFITPIVFRPGALSSISWIVTLNPLFYLLEAIRAPLLGQGLSKSLVGLLIFEAIVGWIAAILFFARVRRRIAFWI